MVLEKPPQRLPRCLLNLQPLHQFIDRMNVRLFEFFSENLPVIIPRHGTRQKIKSSK